jgi:RNA polymerase sigma factor (sigma-70 family)
MVSQALDRAHSGDEAAFAGLVAPYRRELHVHCYRMLGSFDDADDALQETLLAAWRGLAAFQAKASLRTWLYRIATNTCLNLIRTASRRPQMTEPLPATAPPPSGSNEVTWLQPYPDILLDGLLAGDPGPEAQIERLEAVSLAFCHRAAAAVPAGPRRAHPAGRARLHRPRDRGDPYPWLT